jgi:hypothetical protein
MSAPHQCRGRLYAVDGKQYVAVQAGSRQPNSIIPQGLNSRTPRQRRCCTFLVCDRLLSS